MPLSTDQYMQTSLYQELHVIVHVQSIVEKSHTWCILSYKFPLIFF